MNMDIIRRCAAGVRWIIIIMVFAAACLAGCKEDVPAENNGAHLPADAIRVTTPQELLAAIGPNRTIVLTNGGTYVMNLERAKGGAKMSFLSASVEDEPRDGGDLRAVHTENSVRAGTGPWIMGQIVWLQGSSDR